MKNEVFLSVKNLTKDYGPITVLDNVNVDFGKGEIHALIGGNGAGKSTLCKTISGAISPTSGQIIIEGKPYSHLNPHVAKDKGISMVYQEFNLIPELSVYENLFVGKEIRNGIFVDNSEMIAKSEEVFNSMGVTIDCKSKIKDISVAYCQLVEIAKSLLDNSKLLILDEPTAPLTNTEIEMLFKVLEKLKNNGISMIYISHRLDEVFRMCDKVTVLRDGQQIKSMDVKDTNREELINLMIGRKLSQEFPTRPPKFDYENSKTILKVKNINNKKLKNVSFELKEGEILGLAGLVGAGRTEIARAIFGADKIESGSIYIKNEKVEINSPISAIDKGVGLIPEDRKRDGLMLGLSSRTNLSITIIKELSKGLNVSTDKEKEFIEDTVSSLAIKIPSIEQPVSNLSGGNQQKIVLGKWFATDSDIIIFDEPTRGIDVGAKKDIYDFIYRLKASGKSIIMISSEMSEVMNLCDRIIIMHEGEVKGEVTHEEATEEKLMTMSSGFSIE